MTENKPIEWALPQIATWDESLKSSAIPIFDKNDLTKDPWYLPIIRYGSYILWRGTPQAEENEAEEIAKKRFFETLSFLFSDAFDRDARPKPF